MTSTTTNTLKQVETLLAEVCGSVQMARQFEHATAPELVSLLQVLGQVQRRVDAVITAVTGEVADRDCRRSVERVSTVAGCRDVTELLRRTLRVDAGTARRYVTAGDAVHQDTQLSTGDLLPARFPALGDAVRDGVISVTGLLAATGPVERAGNRIGTAERDAVDQLLADTARGLDIRDEHGNPGPAPTTDELADYARALMLALDPDGAEPEDARAHRNRGITLGRARDGLVPLRGGLLPDVAGQLQRLLDALLNPRVDEPAGPDTDTSDASDAWDPVDPGELPVPDGLPDPEDLRSPAQKRHDAFAAILTTAAATGGFPTLGGAAPTLVVSVTAADYTAGTGRAYVEGTGWDVPIGVARHAACAGGIQRVLFDDHGQIVSIGTTGRIFTPRSADPTGGTRTALGADPEPAVEPTAWNSPTPSPHAGVEQAANRCGWADPVESA